MTQPQSKLVRITVEDHVAHSRDHVAQITACLTAPKQHFAPLGKYGTTSKTLPVQYARLEGDRACFSPGLVAWVGNELARQGFTVEVDDRRTLPKPLRIPLVKMDAAPPGEDDLLDALFLHTRGQIEVANTQEMLKQIAVIVRSFPKCQILVISPTVRRARQMWYWLDHRFPYYVQLARGSWLRKRPIVCTTPCYDRSPGTWQIVLITDPPELSRDSAVEKITSSFKGPQRIYAFPRRDWRPGPVEALAVQNVAGPVIYRTHPIAAINRQVCRAAQFYFPPSQPGLEAKRQVWQHPGRNDMIAKIATAFAQRDCTALWELGLMLRETDVKWLETVENKIRVTVLVESTEQGMQLQRRLAEWRLLTTSALPISTINTTNITTTITNTSKTIMTMVYAREHGIETDVLIRADGSSDGGMMMLPGLTPAHYPAHDGMVVLVEVEDGLTKMPQRPPDPAVCCGRGGRGDKGGKGIECATPASTASGTNRQGQSRESDHGHRGSAAQLLPQLNPSRIRAGYRHHLLIRYSHSRHSCAYHHFRKESLYPTYPYQVHQNQPLHPSDP